MASSQKRNPDLSKVKFSSKMSSSGISFCDCLVEQNNLNITNIRRKLKTCSRKKHVQPVYIIGDFGYTWAQK